VALNKITDTCRRRLESQSYSKRREQWLFPIPSTEPTPSQFAIAGEKWAEIAASLPASHVAVVQRLRDGFSHEEVAKMAGISVRTVARIVDRVHRLCEDAP
jgi:DNA-directed RNA polymerase specialized sigma24 family protein